MPPIARRASRTHLMHASPKSDYSDTQAHISPVAETSLTFNHPTRSPPGLASTHRASHPNHLLARGGGREHHHDYDLHAGAEPGIDPLSGRAIAEYGHFQQECVIDVIDYDCDDVTFRRFTNEGLVNMLKEPAPVGEEDAMLPPRMVRWINIGGVDWSVLSALALKYNLHSLTLEDILHERGHNHSKADYYPGHLFLRVLAHVLELEDAVELNSYDASQGPEPCTSVPDDNQPVTSLDLEGGGYVVFDPKQKGKHKHLKPTHNIRTLVKSPTPEDSPPLPPVKGNGENGGFFGSFVHLPLKKRFTGLSGFGGEARERKQRAIEMLKKDERVRVKHEPMFIFLLPNGTVISIHTTPSLDFTSPIAERLHRPDSILRVSEDASLLVEGLLDLIVDRVLEVIDEYQVKISQVEHDILLHPVMRSVRSLHILSGDMIMHKRTLDPIKTMIFGLRHYDLQRSQAITDYMARERRLLDTDSETTVEDDSNAAPRTGAKKKKHAEGQKAPMTEEKAHRRRRKKREMLREERSRATDPPRVRPPSEYAEGDRGNAMRLDDLPTNSHKVHGYFSFKAKVYLADVSDHMDYAITSLEMFSGIAENLLNYAFNIASYDMNVIMNRLTITTIIFLPLTLLTGYFGMNFTDFWSVNGHSDFFFWKIALPAMAVLIPILMYRDIRDVIGYLKRRAETRRVAARL